MARTAKPSTRGLKRADIAKALGWKEEGHPAHRRGLLVSEGAGMMTLKLKCPNCGGSVKSAEAMDVATTTVNRTCPKCRKRWFVTINLIKTGPDRLIHKLEWNPREQTRSDSGQYSYEGQWDRLCVCGCKFGIHAAAAPHPCFADEHGDSPHPCAKLPKGKPCLKFRPASK